MNFELLDLGDPLCGLHILLAWWNFPNTYLMQNSRETPDWKIERTRYYWTWVQGNWKATQKVAFTNTPLLEDKREVQTDKEIRTERETNFLARQDANYIHHYCSNFSAYHHLQTTTPSFQYGRVFASECFPLMHPKLYHLQFFWNLFRVYIRDTPFGLTFLCPGSLPLLCLPLISSSLVVAIDFSHLLWTYTTSA